MKRFAYGMMIGVAALAVGLVAAYATVAIGWPRSLPAPAIGRLVHIDEKLRFIRENPDLDPRILAVGSSITWRQLDGAAFESMAGGRPGFFNGATGALKIHQTSDLVDFYLAHFPNVRTVLILTGQEDFSDCSTEPAQMLDHSAAADYAFDGWPAAYFYLRHFSPQRYARTAWTLAERRRPLVGDLYLDGYGSSPLSVPASMQRGLRYRPVDADPACAAALVALSHRLAGRDIRLVVVFTPVHPDYLRAYPAVSAWTDRAVRQIGRAIADDGGQIVSLHDDPRFRPADFYDAYHLQWPAVRRLSAIVAAAMRYPGGGLLEPTAEGGIPIAEQTRALPAPRDASGHETR